MRGGRSSKGTLKLSQRWGFPEREGGGSWEEVAVVEEGMGVGSAWAGSEEGMKESGVLIF